ncbi:MAG: VanZ family protein [Saccharofermentanales bacterium]
MIIDSEFVFIPFLITVIIYSLVRVFLYKNKTRRYLLIDLLFIIYLFLVFKSLYFPIVINFSRNPEALYHMNLIPFKSIFSSTVSFGSVAVTLGNLLLFVPLSIYLTLRFPRNPAFGFTITFFVSMTAELMQFLLMLVTKSNNRVIDIDDLMLNLLGSVIAWIIINKYLYGAVVRKTQI